MKERHETDDMSSEAVDSNTDDGGNTDRRAYLFALAPALVVLGVAPVLAYLFPSPITFEVGALRLVGVPFVVAGIGLAVWAVDSFARAGETPSPAETSDSLVSEGAFSYTRNPIYLGTVVAGFGAGVALESVVVVGYSVLLWVVYHVLTVYKEEPALREKLGERYEEYCEDVPRWV